MTPARAALAALLATVMLIAGALIVARTGGHSGADFLEILLAGPAPGLWCFLVAAGAVAMGAAGIVTAFLAFIAREEDDDGPFRRRGFPKAAPLVLILLAYALVWYALRCAPSVVAAAPIAVAVAPEAPLEEPVADEVDDALQGGDPVADLDLQGSSTVFGETDFDWTFKNPLIRDDGHRWMTRERPFTDDRAGGANDRLLCNKAWIAVTGSSSEEGPADRNAARSRLRALEAAAAARAWLARRPDCGEPLVFAVDLGQHEGAGGDDSGLATAHQRRVLVAARVRNAGDAAAPEAARAELGAMLASPASREIFFGGRRFRAEPVILAR